MAIDFKGWGFGSLSKFKAVLELRSGLLPTLLNSFLWVVRRLFVTSLSLNGRGGSNWFLIAQQPAFKVMHMNVAQIK